MNLAELLAGFEQQTGITINVKEPGTTYVLTSPVSGSRNHTVTAELVRNELYNRQMIRISSVVCNLTDNTDLAMLLEQTSYFSHCRFVLRKGQIHVEAVTRADMASPDLIREMITEAANLADQYEMKLTGKDQH